MLTKRQAIALFGSVKELQSALGLKSHASVSMWGGDDAAIPDVHELRIRYELKPECFAADGKLIKRPKAT